MILESYIQALLKLIKSGKISVENIKNEDYKNEIKIRLETE